MSTLPYACRLHSAVTLGSLLSVIGLGLDLIGASMVALGLFRPASSLYPGAGRRPSTAAADQAFGGVGVVFLICGFATQACPEMGVDHPSGSATPAAAMTLGMGGRASIPLVWARLYGSVSPRGRPATASENRAPSGRPQARRPSLLAPRLRRGALERIGCPRSRLSTSRHEMKKRGQ